MARRGQRLAFAPAKGTKAAFGRTYRIAEREKSQAGTADLPRAGGGSPSATGTAWKQVVIEMTGAEMNEHPNVTSGEAGRAGDRRNRRALLPEGRLISPWRPPNTCETSRCRYRSQP